MHDKLSKIKSDFEKAQYKVVDTKNSIWLFETIEKQQQEIERLQSELILYKKNV